MNKTLNDLATKLANYKISKLTKEIKQDQNLPANIKNKSKKKYGYDLDPHFYVKKSLKKPIKVSNERSNISQLKELRKLTELGLFKISFKSNYILFKPTKLSKHVMKINDKHNTKYWLDINGGILFACLISDLISIAGLSWSDLFFAIIIANLSVLILANLYILVGSKIIGNELTADTYLKAVKNHVSHHKYLVLKQKLGK